jgi:hypothetical protein
MTATPRPSQIRILATQTEGNEGVPPVTLGQPTAVAVTAILTGDSIRTTSKLPIVGKGNV